MLHEPTVQEMLEAFNTYRSRSQADLKTVVLTGGPCGGKSDFLARARSHFEKRYDCKVVTLPEVAREFMCAGFQPSDAWQDPVAFQKYNVLEILRREYRYIQMLESMHLNNTKVLLIGDRAIMDGAAYIGIERFHQALTDIGIDPDMALIRYDMVLHLVSAAVGAESHYKTDDQRRENLLEAKEIDPKTIEAWKAHPRHVVIDNKTCFVEKIERAVQSIVWTLDLDTVWLY